MATYFLRINMFSDGLPRFSGLRRQNSSSSRFFSASDATSVALACDSRVIFSTLSSQAFPNRTTIYHFPAAGRSLYAVRPGFDFRALHSCDARDGKSTLGELYAYSPPFANKKRYYERGYYLDDYQVYLGNLRFRCGTAVRRADEDGGGILRARESE